MPGHDGRTGFRRALPKSIRLLAIKQELERDMRIAVVTRQVPDSNAIIKVKSDGSGIELAGVKLVMDPFDEFGIEQAVRLKEGRSDVEEVVAITKGSSKSAEVLRTALAIGADRAIHIDAPELDSQNEVFNAKVMAAALKKQPNGFDLILAGKKSIDLDAGDTGPALAEYLGFPHVAAVTALEVSADGKTLKARRRIEGAEELVECELPAVVTCEKGLCECRYPSLPNLMKAKKKPVDTLTAADLSEIDAQERSTMEMVGVLPPAARPSCRILKGEPEAMAAELVQLLREEAKVV
jgi:electron transfer flavoprotein beta subunit